jgi:hypothetical protein
MDGAPPEEGSQNGSVMERIALAGIWGLYAATDVPPELPLVDKLGLAAVTAVLIYWITSRLSKQLDEQTAALKDLASIVADLAATRRVDMEGK